MCWELLVQQLVRGANEVASRSCPLHAVPSAPVWARTSMSGSAPSYGTPVSMCRCAHLSCAILRGRGCASRERAALEPWGPGHWHLQQCWEKY